MVGTYYERVDLLKPELDLANPEPDSADACDLQMDVVYLANLLCQTTETSGKAGGTKKDSEEGK